VAVTNVLIPWYPISYLTIASSVFFWGALTGPYLTLRFGGACGLGVGAFDLEQELPSVAFSFYSFARHNDNLNVKHVLFRERAKKQKKKKGQ
jgi:hypothetical protein